MKEGGAIPRIWVRFFGVSEPQKVISFGCAEASQRVAIIEEPYNSGPETSGKPRRP